MNLLPSCREVRLRLTDYAEGAMPWRERLSLRLHLLLCTACGRFHRGLLALPALARVLLAHDGERQAPPEANQALENALDRIRRK